MSQSLEDLGAHIKSSMTSAIEAVSVAHGELTIQARAEQIVAVITFLRDDPRGRFTTLIDICGVDYPERGKRFDVVYHLLSLHLNQRIRIKIETDEDTPVPSIAAISPCADWFEREAFDMYGILFANHPDLRRSDESDSWGQIAVQGPKALALLTEVFGFDVAAIGSFKFKQVNYENAQVIVATTGYTGEKGAEVFVPANLTSKLWQELLSKGKKFDVLPIGLGARDTLRTEMKYSLYGHEIDDHSNPYEAEIGWVVKPKAKDFINKDQILQKKNSGLSRKLIGFKMKDKGIPRQGYSLFSKNNEPIGIVTSGTHSPSLDEPIGESKVLYRY